MHIFLIGLFLVLTSFVVTATDTFDSYQSEHEKLKGFVIVDAGNTEKVHMPFDSYQTDAIFKLNSRCFTSNTLGGIGFVGTASLLLVNENKEMKIALIENKMSNLQVNIEPIRVVECSSGKSDFDKQLEKCGANETCIKNIFKYPK